MREIKFRAWDGKEMFAMYFNSCYSRWNDSMPVMQYTGLKDKNGKEIYEGDIIESPYRREFRLGYDMGRKVIEWEECGEDIAHWIGYTLDFNVSKCEVIGNIYENPI